MTRGASRTPGEQHLSLRGNLAARYSPAVAYESDGSRPAAGPADYPAMLAEEARFWGETTLTMEVMEATVPPGLQTFINTQLTGRPASSWFDDLTERGPFGATALLGATCGHLESQWLERKTSTSLDIYELSPRVIERTRARLSALAGCPAVRFFECDLNGILLPPEEYDLIWASSTLHHLVALERLCDEVHRALRPGGTFAFYEYVGENRLQFGDRRLALSEETLRCIPPEFWLDPRGISPPELDGLSPFEAARSAEIVEIVQSRFETVHYSTAGAVLPAYFGIDLHRLEQGAPHLLEAFHHAEHRCAAEGLGGCVGYGVFRRRQGA